MEKKSDKFDNLIDFCKICITIPFLCLYSEVWVNGKDI